MHPTLDILVRTLLVGVGATVAMDLWALALRRVGIPSLDLALLGRWVGHLPRGTWLHASIAAAPRVPHERLLGWLAHYAIGVSFAALLMAAFGAAWAHAPTLGPALLVGLVTVAAPLFVLQPALGLGIASRRTSRPVFNATKSVVTHAVYGLGLYLSALLVAAALPPTSPA